MHVSLLLISHWWKPAIWPNPNAGGGEVKFYHEPKRDQKYLVDSTNDHYQNFARVCMSKFEYSFGKYELEASE